mgnify:FL=1
MSGAELIPAEAWIQAVFVCLFIVLVLWLLAWFSKQNEKWQNFIAQIEEQWRAFSKEQRTENNACMREVNQGLTDLTTVTQGLVAEVKEMREDSQHFYASFREHDQQAKEILAEVKTNGKPAPKPRVKKEPLP